MDARHIFCPTPPAYSLSLLGRGLGRGSREVPPHPFPPGPPLQGPRALQLESRSRAGLPRRGEGKVNYFDCYKPQARRISLINRGFRFSEAAMVAGFLRTLAWCSTDPRTGTEIRSCRT